MKSIKIKRPHAIYGATMSSRYELIILLTSYSYIIVTQVRIYRLLRLINAMLIRTFSFIAIFRLRAVSLNAPTMGSAFPYAARRYQYLIHSHFSLSVTSSLHPVFGPDS